MIRNNDLQISQKMVPNENLQIQKQQFAKLRNNDPEQRFTNFATKTSKRTIGFYINSRKQ